MSDLIERLRDQSRNMFGSTLGSEAADELERLEHEIDVQCSSQFIEDRLKDIERLTAQIKALESDDHEWYLQSKRIDKLEAAMDESYEPGCDCACCDIVREALEAK